MFRVTLANAFAKRSLRPLHEKHQATPVQVLLDSTETEVYSGQVAELDPVTGLYVKFTAGTPKPAGLFALDKNDVINDADGQPTDLPVGDANTGTPFAIWQGGPDAYFRVTDPGNNEVISSPLAVGDVVYGIAGGLLDNTGAATDIIGTVTELINTDGYDVVIRVTVPNDGV